MLDQTPKIPDYEIISPLGSGTSGQVWLAKDQFGERRAIKVTHIDYVNSPDYQRRFRREVRAQQQLYAVSSHVARIFDYDEKHVPPYIVMDYINGIDLNRLIAMGEMGQYNLQTRLHWIEAIASTLTKAHAIRIPGNTHGIIHRDIKPQNIRIQGHRPYLLDFSISLTSDVEIDSTQDAMTLRYVAPEISASEASDIFSFGLVAFEILYEIHPIMTNEEAAKIKMSDYIGYVEQKLRNNDWRLPSMLDSNMPALNSNRNRKRLDMIFHKVLSVDPAYRFRSPKEFSDELLVVLLGSQSSPDYSLYISKHTTETPLVTIQVDDSDVDSTHDRIQPEETRQFPPEEINSMEALDDRLVTDESKPEDIAPTEAPDQPPTEGITDTVTARATSSIEPQINGVRKRSFGLFTFLLSIIIVFIIGIMLGNRPNSVVPVVTQITSTRVVTDRPISSTSQISGLMMTSITSTTTPVPSNTPTLTATYTLTATTTLTSSVTSTPVPTNTPTDSPSQTSTSTLTTTARPTQTSIPTNTPTARPTQTSMPTNTPTARPTQTPTNSPTATPEAWQIEQQILSLAGTSTRLERVYIPMNCPVTDTAVLCISENVWIDYKPISNETYDLCFRSGVCGPPALRHLYDPAGAGANNPVVGVNLRMAETYCDWREARLPTASEIQLLFITIEDTYKDLSEWARDEDSRVGQSQIYNFSDGKTNGIWLESSYLGDDVTFRCVQSG